MTPLPTELPKGGIAPFETRLDTPHGAFTIQRACSLSLIEQLTVDEGFGNILRPIRAKATFQRIAARPSGNVTLAYTPDHVVAGYLMIARPEPMHWQQRVIHERWEQCEALYELGSLEVSKNFRSLGIADQLMQAAFAGGAYDDLIVVAETIRWHWDLTTAQGSALVYRDRLLALMKRYGFEEFGTDDADVRSDPANALIARIGPNCPQEHVEHLHSLRYVSRRVIPKDSADIADDLEPALVVGGTERGFGKIAGDCMTPDPFTVAPEDTLKQAWDLMNARHIRHLPVLAEGKVVGIITDRMVREAMPSPEMIAQPEEVRSFLSMVQVAERMRREVLAGQPITPIERAARLFLEHRIGCLPVLEENRLVGILTKTDLLQALVDILAEREHPGDPESLD